MDLNLKIPTYRGQVTFGKISLKSRDPPLPFSTTLHTSQLKLIICTPRIVDYKSTRTIHGT